MEVRSYYASTVEAALELARKELGSEAMLIQSNRTSPELAHLGRYEVVFAGEVQQRSPLPKAAASEVKSPEPPHQFPFPAKHLVVRPPSVIRAGALSPEESATLGPVDLVSGSPNLSRKLPSPSSPPQPSSRSTRIIEQTQKDIPCNPTLRFRAGSGASVALIGPSAAGKTLTLMKLAVAKGILQDRPVRLFAIDPNRVSSTARLRDFAGLLDLPFSEFDTAGELAAELEDQFGGLTLIDTPDHSVFESVEAAELSRALRALPDLQTHLVLRADRKLADNFSALDRFRSFAPSRLILTAVDETTCLDDVPALIDRAEMPISFVGTGQRIPEDLEDAHSRRIGELISQGWRKSARTAA